MKLIYDFSIQRYLAQKFPILCSPQADRLSDSDSRGAIYRWPSEVGWEISGEDQRKMDDLTDLKRRRLTINLDGSSTVEDALRKLDRCFLKRIEKRLPQKVADLFTRYLSEQWKLFSTQILPADYLS